MGPAPNPRHSTAAAELRPRAKKQIATTTYTCRAHVADRANTAITEPGYRALVRQEPQIVTD